MAHRPYPNADRARRMIDRHEFEEPPASVEPMVSPFTIHLAEAAQAAAEGLGRSVAQMLARVAQTEPGDYVLSTRHPDTVSGPSYS